MSHADTWQNTLNAAAQLDPHAIHCAILATADDGLRAAAYDRHGGRTSFRPCDDPHCDDGNPDLYPHSHLHVSDPTGEAAVNQRRTDNSTELASRLHRARHNFIDAVSALNRQLRYGPDATDWDNAHTIGKQLTAPIAAAEDTGWNIGYWINQADKAVNSIKGLARAAGVSRAPTRDERDWTSGLADDDCCVWHLEIHRRYRRRRIDGKNICQTCANLALVGGGRPPQWLLEAELDREGKPKSWQQALSRWLDELGIPQHRRSAS